MEPKDNTSQKDLLLIETIVKLAAINKLLVKKGIISDTELQAEMTEISKNLLEQFKQLMPEFAAQLKFN